MGGVLDDHEAIHGVTCVVGETEPIREEEICKEHCHVVRELVILGHNVQKSLFFAQNVDRDEVRNGFAYAPICVPASSGQICQQQVGIRNSEKALADDILVFKEIPNLDIIFSSS